MSKCPRALHHQAAVDTGNAGYAGRRPARGSPHVQMYTADCPAKQPRASQIAVAAQVKQAAIPPLPSLVLAWRTESTDVHNKCQHRLVIAKGVGSDANIQEGWGNWEDGSGLEKRG